MVAYETLIPVNAITGFLGSGKTTLLKRLLASPRLADTAVLINEFGEVGLDHLLLERIDEEVVVLESGCVCCTIRGDLKEAILKLYEKRQAGEIPPFDRLAIETSGLADPAPIVFTIMADAVLRHHFRMGNTIATVDGVNGLLHLERNSESVKQVLVADRLVVTKSDLCNGDHLARLRQRLTQLNPSAPLVDANAPAFDPDDLLAADIYDPERKLGEVRNWLATPEAHPHHSDEVRSFCLTYDHPLDWTAFGIWLTMLLHSHGEKVLRVKGILNVAGEARPLVIQGVQHLIHPPTPLARWPDADRRSRIVFILRELEPALLKRSLAAFNRLGPSSESPTAAPLAQADDP
jgi:G3E family GTPase